MQSNSVSKMLVATVGLAYGCALYANPLASWSFNEPAGTTLTNVVDSINGASFSGDFGITSNRTFDVADAIAPQIDSIVITAIPEPSTCALILGLLGFAGVLLRRRLQA